MNIMTTGIPALMLEPGKTYLTKDNRKAHCLGVSPWKSETPVAVAIEGRKCIESYSADGKFRGGNHGSKGSHSLDIVSAYRPPVVAWVAFRHDGTVFDFFEARPMGEIAENYHVIKLVEAAE